MIWSRKLSYLSFLTLVLATASGACVIESDGDDDDDAGSAGAAGSGASGTSGKSGGSGTAGVGGSGGSSGASGAGGASGGGGSGGSGGSVSSECGLLQGPAEAEPNGDTTTATAYALGVASHGCIVEADLDTYSFTTPDDGTGGGVLIEFTEVGKGSATPLGTLSVSVRTEGDNGDLYNTYNPNAGGNLSAYFAAAPGRTYYVQVGAFSSGDAKFVYTMKATYTPVADAFEPNDTPATATPIGVNMPYSAYYFSGYTSAAEPAEAQLQDYYAVELAAGTATVKLTNAPNTYTAAIDIAPVAGDSVGNSYTVTPGADVTINVNDLDAGTYLIKVTNFGSGFRLAGDATALPEHFTKPYEISVTQP